jgi:hypothetical protein
MRIDRKLVSGDKPRPKSILRILTRVFGKHGFQRAIGLAFLVQPLAILVTSRVLSRPTIQVLSLLPDNWAVELKSQLFFSLQSQLVSQYHAKPLTTTEQGRVSTLYIHTPENLLFGEWRNLVPNVKFVATRANHESMLNYPYVEELLKQLSHDNLMDFVVDSDSLVALSESVVED